MLHNSPLLYHTKAELEILLSFLFHCSTCSENANFWFCDLLHRHKPSCCLLEPFTFFVFFLKLSYKEASWFALKYFRQLAIWAAVSTALLFALYFLLIPNETTEQALVGTRDDSKGMLWCRGAVGTDLSWHRTRRISLPHWVLVDSHTVSTGHTRAKGRYCNMWESIAGALKIECQGVILNSF